MRVIRTFPLTASLLCSSLLGCGSDLEDDGAGIVEPSSQALIGGQEATPGQFPSTLYVENCTASKVGPRHILTAAHCVVDPYSGALLPFRTSGATVRVTEAVRLEPQTPSYPLQIRQVWVHPSYLGREDVSPIYEPVPADVAIIEVEGGLEHIPIAPLDHTPLTQGTAVILQGYGCEAGLGTVAPVNRLKYQNTHVSASDAIAAVMPYAGQAPVSSTASSYFFTPGPGVANGAGLCPGDSGGPVYRMVDGKLRTVGVNAYYSFDPGETVPRFNWLTRLDTKARHRTGAWLADVIAGRCGTFTDICSSRFREDIIYIQERGITEGCAETRYCPKATVTRAQMASFLVRALGLPPGGPDAFDDDDGTGSEADINALAAAGVVRGCGVRKFCPRNRVTRAQMASFIVRGFKLPPGGPDAFDDDGGNVHEADINALAANGIANGCGTRRFCPKNRLTRGQLAALLRRALERTGR